MENRIYNDVQRIDKRHNKKEIIELCFPEAQVCYKV